MRDIRQSRVGLAIGVGGILCGVLTSICGMNGLEWVTPIVLLSYVGIVGGVAFALLRGASSRTFALLRRNGAELDVCLSRIEACSIELKALRSDLTAERGDQRTRFDDIDRRGRAITQLVRKTQAELESLGESSTGILRSSKELADQMGGIDRLLSRHLATMSRQLGGVAGGVHQANLARPQILSGLTEVEEELTRQRKLLKEILWSADVR